MGKKYKKKKLTLRSYYINNYYYEEWEMKAYTFKLKKQEGRNPQNQNEIWEITEIVINLQTVVRKWYESVI